MTSLSGSTPTRRAAPVKPAAAGKAAPAAGKNLSPADLKRRLLERKTAKPIAFSLDEVREIAKKNEKRSAQSAGATDGRTAGEAARVSVPPAMYSIAR